MIDSVRATAVVVGPVLARGVIQRRPRAVGLAQRLNADARAVERMQVLRDRYGPGPVLLNIPGRNMALVLDAEDVFEVLNGSPEPFATATREKRGALEHFQPEGVLVSHGRERQDRRRFNEAVLDADEPVHAMAEPILAKVVEEADVLAEHIGRSRRLEWEDYIDAWWRMVRRVVLGDAARDDHAVTDFLAELRAAANWSFLRPEDPNLRRRFYRQLQGHLDRAEPGSLAGAIASAPTTHQTRPAQQVPQWLFAYDAAAWASYRALALLGSHPDQANAARDELRDRDLRQAHNLTYLRACVLESLRLWPTTPAVLRETTRETSWRTGTLPAGTSLLIFAPLFHRDDRTLDYADRFAPEVWLDRGTDDLALGPVLRDEWPLIPFSAGPAVCPGRNLVLLTASTMLGRLLQAHDLRLEEPEILDPDGLLPGTLSPFEPVFGIR
jgi:cytochrome P450